MSAVERSTIHLARRCADSALWCMREQARLRGDLPGPAHYSHEQLQAWAEGHAEMAFRLSALFADEPPTKARFVAPLDPSPTSPGGLPLGRSLPGGGSIPSPHEELP